MENNVREQLNKLNMIRVNSRLEIGMGIKRVVNYMEANPFTKHLVVEWYNGIVNLYAEGTAKINEGEYEAKKYKEIYRREGWTITTLSKILEATEENMQYYPLYK